MAALIAPLLAENAGADTVSQTLVAFNSQWHAGLASGPEKPTILIRPGDTLQLRIENHDFLFHTFSLPHFAIDQELDNGTTSNPTVVTVTIPTSAADEGKWQFYCRLHSSGSEENRDGMVGWIEVPKSPEPTPGFEVWTALGAGALVFIGVTILRRRE